MELRMEKNRKNRIRLHNVPELKTFRKELRNQLTPAEAKLWSYLKASQLDGRKFRRQHSVGPYILDFYCPTEQLAIELDGQAHASLSAHDYDHERDLFLAYFEVLVIRFENKSVFECPEGVLNYIKQHFGWRGDNHPGLTATRGVKQPPRPSGTPPFKGGEF